VIDNGVVSETRGKAAGNNMYALGEQGRAFQKEILSGLPKLNHGISA